MYSKKENPNNSARKMVYSLVLGLIVLAGLSAAGFIYLYNQTSFVHEQGIITDNQLNYEREKLSFCYNNNLRPCTDDELKEWNGSHPNSIFKLKTFAELVEEGIRQSK